MEPPMSAPTGGKRAPKPKSTPEEIQQRLDRFCAMMKHFREDFDEDEVNETREVLMKALAESRESNRESRGWWYDTASKEEQKMMDTLTRTPNLFELHPELKISPEDLKKRNARALETLRKWDEEGDEAEQKETGEFLMKALAEARESSRECKE